MDCSRARSVKRRARDVNSHEPEPEVSGTLYGGAEVEPGMEAEVERSMLYTVIVVVVVSDSRCAR